MTVNDARVRRDGGGEQPVKHRTWNERRRARRASVRKALRRIDPGGAALGCGVAGIAVPVFAPLAWWLGRRARRRSPVGTSRASRMAAAWGWLLGMLVTCAVMVVAFGVLGVAVVLGVGVAVLARRCRPPIGRGRRPRPAEVAKRPAASRRVRAAPGVVVGGLVWRPAKWITGVALVVRRIARVMSAWQRVRLREGRGTQQSDRSRRREAGRSANADAHGTL